MNRKDFTKLLGLGAVALHSFPSMAFNHQKIDPLELIGKGNPTVFGNGFSIRKEAYDAFVKMRAAAAKEGIDIHVVSSYRNYAHQNRIWERKYKRFTKQGLSPINAIKKIITYSTIPGTSRHHWGTDIDIIDKNSSYSGDVLVPKKFHGDGPFCKLREWLEQHANTYDFHIVYTDDAHRKGFKYEPWHYSYAPLSIPMLKEYQKLDIKAMLQAEKLMGSEHFNETFINSYIKENILDINPELLS
ncbi:putative carboxypeptidase YodJ [Kordia sp. SMS9]|uniref:M15 family metallopeptidase n=1 Tax=Kordia sp. SMS9 TaxID=2282170 RepID=UPI000E0CFAAA|nr:M15 family metallopeptidase [Kordia sp. SMS9]AXG69949.1 putative carboxypeptidase YodJ [Kordia sp. SMS9]